MEEKEYDYIVIGAGIGGITASIILSKFYKKKVLLIEQSDKIGGYIQTYKKYNSYFNIGVHYIANMTKNKIEYQLMNYLTDKKITWNPLPKKYDFIYSPGKFFYFDKKKEDNINNLIKKYPEEKEKIKRYFKLSKCIYEKIEEIYIKKLNGNIQSLEENNSIIIKEVTNMTTYEFIKKITDNERLINDLTSQWPLIGLPQKKQSIISQILINEIYAQGGFYPKGGSKNLISELKKQIDLYKIDVSLNTKALGINTKDKKIRKLIIYDKIKDKKITMDCKKIISNIGHMETYNLIKNNDAIKKEKNHIKKIKPSISTFFLHASLKENPQKYGATASNYWIYTDEKYEAILITFPSLKDNHTNNHTLEIMASTPDYSKIKKIKNESIKDYTLLKERIKNKLIKILESKFEGIKVILDNINIATPLTLENKINHINGQIYGLEKTPKRMKMDKHFSIKNKILNNLYMCGADTLGQGITTCMLSGVGAACVSQGKGEFDNFVKNGLKKSNKK